MSRIGNKPIPVLDGVKVAVDGRKVNVEGPKGKLQFEHRREVAVKVDGKNVVVTRANDERQARAYHGLTRALLNNMIFGVKNGYEKKLEIIGVGYQAAIKGKAIDSIRNDLTSDSPLCGALARNHVETLVPFMQLSN